MLKFIFDFESADKIIMKYNTVVLSYGSKMYLLL